MILYSTQHVKIGYEAGQNLIWSEWIGSVPSTEFREAIEISLALAKKENPPYWLSDNKLATILAPEDQDWVNEYFIPQLVELGCKKMAIIMPEEFYNQMILDDMLSKGEQVINFEVQYFSDETSAMEWIGDLETTLVYVNTRAANQYPVD